MNTESASKDLLAEAKIKAFLVENRRVLMGGVLLLAAVIGVTLIYQEMSQRSDQHGWQAFLASTKDMPADQVSKIEGTSAEPWYLYQRAAMALNDKKYDDAAGFVKRLEEKYPHHYLTYARTIYSDKSLAGQLKDSIQSEQEWTKANPLVESNPEAPKDQTCTFKTSKGDFAIGLYLDKAPESCKLFIQHVNEMKGQYIRTISPELFLVAGQEPASATSTPKEGREPPSEETGLYHFKGAVSFDQGYNAGPDQQNLPLFIALAPNLMRDEQQTVFASVIDGLDRLMEWSKEKRGESTRSMDLAEPIRIDDVVLNVHKEGWNVEELQKPAAK